MKKNILKKLFLKSFVLLFFAFFGNFKLSAHEAKHIIIEVPNADKELYNTLLESLLAIGYNIISEDKENRVIKANITVFTAKINLDCRISDSQADSPITKISIFATKKGVGPKNRIYRDVANDIYIKIVNKYEGSQVKME